MDRLCRPEPDAYIKKYRDRIETVRFKTRITRYADVKEEALAVSIEHPFSESVAISQDNQLAQDNISDIKPLIGRDQVNWQSVIDVLVRGTNPIWFVVEQEIYPEDMAPMAAVQRSMKGLQNELSQ